MCFGLNCDIVSFFGSEYYFGWVRNATNWRIELSSQKQGFEEKKKFFFLEVTHFSDVQLQMQFRFNCTLEKVKIRNTHWMTSFDKWAHAICLWQKKHFGAKLDRLSSAYSSDRANLRWSDRLSVPWKRFVWCRREVRLHLNSRHSFQSISYKSKDRL